MKKYNLLEKLLKAIYLEIRQKEYEKFVIEKTSWWKYSIKVKEHNIGKEEEILNDFDKQLNVLKSFFWYITVILITLFIFILPPAIDLTRDTVKEIKENVSNQKLVSPALIVNCISDPVCNKPIEGLNINIESQQIIISKETIKYYKQKQSETPNWYDDLVFNFYYPK